MKKILWTLVVFLVSLSLWAEGGKVTLFDAKGKEKSFATISEALKAVRGSGDYKITLQKGIYEEALYYNGGAKITISGETKSKFGSDVVIRAENDGDILLRKESDKAMKNRCVFEFEGTGSLTLENLTIQNAFARGSREGKNTQAEALGFDSTGNLAAYNCSFKSHQDTLRTTGKAWFYQCYVEGDVDFLWMEQAGKVALYEECEIFSVYDEKNPSHTSYICAPRMSVASSVPKGLVVLNSSVSSAKGQKTYLARTPWKEGYYSQVAYINTKMQGVEESAWYKVPLTAKKTARTVIGWKMDKATATNLGLSVEGRDDILDDETVSAEYGSRDAILNRVVNLKGVYKKDSPQWNVSELAEKMGWSLGEN